MTSPDIIVTSVDFERLQSLLETHAMVRDKRAIEFLETELARARVVAPSQVPPGVVTMNSRFRYIDTSSGDSQTVTLVYPADSDAGSGRLSVLAPVGCALLGLSVGQTIQWPLPNGAVRSFRIAEILYQPEAAGHLNP